ncbi:MAG: HIT family protein, partial [Halobacteriaceae archaeon]
MDDCAFCEIINGERDAYVLHEDENTMAFLDRDPAILGHALIVPKTHDEHLFTESTSRSRTVFETVRTVARAMDRALDPDGVSLFYTSAELVGRVMH